MTAAFCVTSVTFLCAGAFAGTLDLAIMSDQGRPVSSATITVFKVHDPAHLSSPVIGPQSAPVLVAGTPVTTDDALTASVDEGGKASILVSEDTPWTVCASSRSERLLNSCQWTDELPTVKFATGVGRAASTIVLRTGAPIRFRVDDPLGLLKTPPDSGGPIVSVGVITAKGHFYRANEVFKNDKGAEYELLVPQGIDLIVSVTAWGAQVTDQNGVPLDIAPTHESFKTDTAGILKFRTYRLAPPGKAGGIAGR
jgi:hypothetical protein